MQNLTYPISSRQNVHTRRQDFYSFCTFQILQGKPLVREKIRLLTRRFGHFARKSNSTGCKNLKRRLNARKTLSNVEGALEIMERLSDCTFLIRPRIPSSFIFTIISKVYHTFRHVRTFFYDLKTNGDHQENRKEILDIPGETT